MGQIIKGVTTKIRNSSEYVGTTKKMQSVKHPMEQVISKFNIFYQSKKKTTLIEKEVCEVRFCISHSSINSIQFISEFPVYGTISHEK